MTTVLVVDDSAVDRMLAGKLLEKHFDCSVLYAADGKEALQQMGRQLPDLVLSDLQMPEMNGLELTAAVKSDYPFVPIVLMTGLGSEDIAAQALRHGAASYVPKRNLAQDLEGTVRRILLGSLEDHAHSQIMHYLETSEQVFVIDNDLALIKALVSQLQQMLRCLPLADETDRLRVGLAIEEALTNARYHGNLQVGSVQSYPNRRALEAFARLREGELPYRDRRIHVTAKVSRKEAVFVILDEGEGFDTSQLPNMLNLTEADRPSGRGVVLMRTIMDEVVYNKAGNEVTLIKRRAPEPADDDDGPADS